MPRQSYSWVERVLFGGHEKAGTLASGRIIGVISHIPTCEELIERVVAEAEKVPQTTTDKVLDKMPT